MFEDQKPAKQAKKQPKEQNPIKWLLGFKETEDERKARERREAQEKKGREVIDNAIKGGALPKPKKKQ